jgi:phosphoribosylglycinamide formyltransferase-1
MPSEANYTLAILASGGGSNADQICTHFASHDTIRVGVILTNNPNAGVIAVAGRHGIPCHVIPRTAWQDEALTGSVFKQYEITHVVLAGFLLLIPKWLINCFPSKIINIHPALLPRYGGKGMYGHHVHQAVKHAGDLVSGITIHEVNEHYDEGNIIFQQEVILSETDTPDEIGEKVLAVEHRYYPIVIERWVMEAEKVISLNG